MGKKSRRNKLGKVASGLSRREAIQARRNPDHGAAKPTNNPTVAAASTSQSQREQANQLMAAFILLSKDDRKKWNQIRIQIMMCYHDLFIDVATDERLVPTYRFVTDEDWAFLKSIYKNEDELAFVRAVALSLWSFLSHEHFKYEDNSHALHVIIKICKEASELETQQLQIMGLTEENHPHETLIGCAIAGIQRLREQKVRPWTAGKSDKPSVLSVGGESCDVCGKLVPHDGVDVMACCSTCELAYYCSKQCQKIDWEQGHKQFCRKKGSCKVGDLVRVVDKDGQLPYGHLVVVLAPVCCPGKKKPKKWLVSDQPGPTGGHTCFILAKNMLPQRPPLFQPYVGKQPVLEELVKVLKTSDL